MKVQVDSVRAHVAVHFDIRGSVLAGTIQAGAPKVETTYDIESPDDPAKVAAMLRNARNGCWVRAAVSRPVPFEDRLNLNGKSFSLD